MLPSLSLTPKGLIQVRSPNPVRNDFQPLTFPHIGAHIAGEQASPSTESGIKKKKKKLYLLGLGAGQGSTPLKYLDAVIEEGRSLG